MGDEISLSVEDTNAIRAKLGLKPLVVGRDSPAQQNIADIGSSSKVDVVESKLEADKEEGKRLLDELTTGGGILDLFGDVPDVSSADPKRVRVSELPADATVESDGSPSKETSSSSDSDSSELDE
jgi:hypothetical protein